MNRRKMSRRKLSRLIDRAAEERWSHLDLSNQDIVKLPKKIAKLESLVSLDLQGNKFTSWPEEIEALVNLRLLDFSNNKLRTLDRGIENLRGLQSLNVSSNHLEALSIGIGSLIDLRHLDLGGNFLMILPPEIGLLQKLEWLDVHGSLLETLPREIKNLANLAHFNLEHNRLHTIPAQIESLLSLRWLNLGRNRLTEVPATVGRLSSLERLSLAENLLNSLPSEIDSLSRLQRLIVRDNKLRALPPELGALTNLEVLNLRNNQLGQIPHEVGNLRNLQYLDLSCNNLIGLPSEIGGLFRLRWLNLEENQLSRLPTTIGKLGQLKVLRLANNNLVTLPFEIGTLGKLRHLQASTNNLSELPEGIGGLRSLEWLDLAYNKITKVPSEIKHLQQLQWLDLRENRLTRLPAEIGGLSKLENLNLNNNQLNVLPKSLMNLRQGAKVLLYGNRDLPIPRELFAENKDPSHYRTLLEAYFAAILPNEGQQLNEGRLLVLGQPTVGKTSLIKQLVGEPFDRDEITTHGIAVRQLERSIKEQQLRLRVWDFGGQEILQGTHQFFLRHRCIYLVVVDARAEESEGRLEYWLQMARAYGKHPEFDEYAPVIVVANKIMEHVQAEGFRLDEATWKEHYPFIKGFAYTDCNPEHQVGIDELKTLIDTVVDNLPGVHDRLPNTWIYVKERLEAKNENYLPEEEFAALCRDEGVEDENGARRLLSVMDLLGIALSYEDRAPETAGTYVLNPAWLTSGVYTLITSPELAANGGFFTLDDLDRLLKSKGYTRRMQGFILHMMRQFELCLQYLDEQHYLLPDLLPHEAPQTLSDFSDALRFEYRYQGLPRMMFIRLMCRLHRGIESKGYWRSGMILREDNGNRALVRFRPDGGGRITMDVTGPRASRRDLLLKVRAALEDIHASIPGLVIQRIIPLPNETAFVNYDELLEHINHSWETIRVPSIGKEFKVWELLNGIQPQEVTQKIVNNYYVQGDFKGHEYISNHNIEIHNSNAVFGDAGSIEIGSDPAAILKAFEWLYERLGEKAELKPLETEVMKGERSKENILVRELRKIAAMGDDILDVVTATLINPAAGAAMIVRKVAAKAREEAGLKPPM